MNINGTDYNICFGFGFVCVHWFSMCVVMIIFEIFWHFANGNIICCELPVADYLLESVSFTKENISDMADDIELNILRYQKTWL